VVGGQARRHPLLHTRHNFRLRIIAADDEGPDGPLGSVVVDRQVSGLDVAFKPAPV
jgi:hypothetical protein